MGKRKRSKDDYDSIRRKIKKLEDKLKERRRSLSDSEGNLQCYESGTCEYDAYKEYCEEVPDVYPDEVIGIYDDYQPEPEPVAETSTIPQVIESTPPVMPEADTAPGPSSKHTETDTHAIPNQDDTPPLHPDILLLLGEDPSNEKNHGEKLNKDIASRWTHILCHRLSKDTRLELTKCYLPPENCPNIKAPKLNLEVKAALLDINVKKDLYSQSKQNQLASSLAALGRVLNWALLSNNIPQDIIKAMSDAGRLICDSHYRESQSRRYAALSSINKNIRDAIKDTDIDEQLFGSALSEHIKTAKTITKTGSEIKQKVQRLSYRPSATRQSRGALNLRGAPPPRIASVVEPRTTPAAPRRPPRDRRLESTRGRRPPTNQARRR